jgi:hypothetical protein
MAFPLLLQVEEQGVRSMSSIRSGVSDVFFALAGELSDDQHEAAPYGGHSSGDAQARTLTSKYKLQEMSHARSYRPELSRRVHLPTG